MNTANVDSCFPWTARWSITQSMRLTHQHQTKAGIKLLKPCFYGLHLGHNRSCKGHFHTCNCVIKSNTNCLTISTTSKSTQLWLTNIQVCRSKHAKLLAGGGESTQKFSTNRKSINKKNEKPFLWSLMSITTLGHLEVNPSKLLEGRMKI